MYRTRVSPVAGGHGTRHNCRTPYTGAVIRERARVQQYNIIG